MSSVGSWTHRFLLAGVGLLILLGIWILGSPAELPTIPGSVTTPGADGRQVAFRLLRETGFEPEAWRQAPLALPTGEHLLWLPSVPHGASGVHSDLFDLDTEPGDEVAPEHADPRHPWNYATFVNEGGTLVLPAGDEELEWLTETVGIELPSWDGIRGGASPLVVVLEDGERLVLSAELDDSDDPGARRPHDGSWHDLAVVEHGPPFASWTPIAFGRVVLLADDAFLRNDTIGDGDDGVFLVRLVEALDRGGRLLFDEYALGLWVPPSTASLLTDPGLLEVTLHALLLVLLVVLAATWAREFPRDPDPLAASPRVRATAQGRLLERARRFDLAAEQLRLGVLRRLALHFKLARAAASLREDSDRETVTELTREVQRRAEGIAPEEEWLRLFVGASVRSRGDLAALAASLDRVEHEILVQGRAHARGEHRER